MNRATPFINIVAIVAILFFLPGPLQAELRLHYAMDGYGFGDRGPAPTAAATEFGTVNVAKDTPAGFSCGALDTTASGSNYLTTGADVNKIDALPAMTVTFWLNLRANPQNYDCIMSDNPGLASAPPAGTGGWDVHIEGSGGSPTADNFKMSFMVCQSSGSVINCNGSGSAAINADHKWVFVAVTYDASRIQRYYVGSETVPAAQSGSTFIFSFPLLDNSTEFRVASDTAAPSVDRTPPAYIDDVRIYNTALTLAQINAIRVENLGYGDINAVPGFLPLKGLAGEGCGSRAYGVSADGNYIVGATRDDGSTHGFRWHDGVWDSIGHLPGGYTTTMAYDVSDDGAVVVGYSASPSATQAFRWESSVITGIGDLPGGDVVSYGMATSADGSVVTGYGTYDANFTDMEGFRWQNNTMTGLGYLVHSSVAYDISSDASVIVGATETATGAEGCLWDSNGLTPIGDLPGGAVLAIAHAISADKSTIVGFSESARGQEAVMWRNNTIQSLGDFPDGFHQGYAYGVSGNGSVIVGYYSGGGMRAFIWSARRGLRDLQQALADDYGMDLTGWRLFSAQGISDDGRTIVGYAGSPDLSTEAFRIRLPATNHSADLNGDGRVNASDSALFALCDTGPSVPYDPSNLPPGCVATVDPTGLISVDYDEDGDVDQTDFGIKLQRCFSGSLGSLEPPPGCLE